MGPLEYWKCELFNPWGPSAFLNIWSKQHTVRSTNNIYCCGLLIYAGFGCELAPLVTLKGSDFWFPSKSHFALDVTLTPLTPSHWHLQLSVSLTLQLTFHLFHCFCLHFRYDFQLLSAASLQRLPCFGFTLKLSHELHETLPLPNETSSEKQHFHFNSFQESSFSVYTSTGTVSSKGFTSDTCGFFLLSRSLQLLQLLSLCIFYVCTSFI